MDIEKAAKVLADLRPYGADVDGAREFGSWFSKESQFWRSIVEGLAEQLSPEDSAKFCALCKLND